MSLMDVLKSCPEQREAFLATLSVSITNVRRDMFIFDPTDLPPPEVCKANLASPFMIEVEIEEFIVK